MHRPTLRALTTAVLVVVVSLPAAGVAVADDSPEDLRGLTSAQLADSSLVASVLDAREEFRTSALDARTALRATLDSIRSDIAADAARSRASVGTSAYRDAWTAARAARQGDIDTAMAAAKSRLMTARLLYARAVTTAFARELPGTTPPRTLLDPAWWVGLSDSAWLTGER